MRILGIDPGLNKTGYGIVETLGNHLKFIQAGCINTSSKKSLDKRLLKIHREITEIIKNTQLDAVVLEKLYAHYKHPLTACLLGHARGIICLICAQNNVDLFEYAATRVKKVVLGKGHASKQQIQQMVLQMLSLQYSGKIPLDTTDALSLAIAHSYIIKKDIFKR